MNVTCHACGGLYDPAALTCDCHHLRAGKLRDARRNLKRVVRACLDLMGGERWAEEYECAHGVPVGLPCHEGAKCDLHSVRVAAKAIRMVEGELRALDALRASR